MAMKILDIPTSSISEVKRSPIEIFQKAGKEAAGVILTKKQYESLNKEINGLYDQIAVLIAEKRLLNENIMTFFDSDVRGSITNEEPAIDKEDG